MRGEGLTRWTESRLEAGVVAVAGGVGVDLMGEGVAPGELSGVEWLTWVGEIHRAKGDRRAGRCRAGSFPRGGV